MNELTTLERRALQSISTPDGHMLIVAADQRNVELLSQAMQAGREVADPVLIRIGQ